MRGLGCLGLARQRRWLLSWAARGVAGAAGEAVGAAAGTPTAVGGSTHTSAAASPVGPAAAQAQATLPPPAAAAPLRLQPAQPACATFLARREVVAEQLYRQYNQRVFGGKLPLDLPILWNPRLRKDAGRVETWRELEVLPGGPAGLVRYRACIILNARVVDTQQKLEDVLCHELCHVAEWVLDRSEPSHGPVFHKWADVIMRVLPHVNITVEYPHSVAYPYRWQCTNSECGFVYGRFSKSIDEEMHQCKRCEGDLVYLGRFREDGTPVRRGRRRAQEQAEQQQATVQQEQAGGESEGDEGSPSSLASEDELAAGVGQRLKQEVQMAAVAAAGDAGDSAAPQRRRGRGRGRRGEQQQPVLWGAAVQQEGPPPAPCSGG